LQTPFFNIMKIKGLIFDFDGLILDTESAEVHIWEMVFQQFGLTFPLDRYMQHVGSATDNLFVQDIMHDLGMSAEQIRSAMDKFEQLFLVDGSFDTPREGVREFILSIKNAHLKLGIASNSYRPWVIGHLQNLHLSQYFDPICTRDEVSNSKPDPEIYNLVLKKWNFTPQQVVAFEDSPTGVRAAKNAGIYCAAIPNPITAKMDISHADVIFNSFTEVDLHEIMRNLEN